MSQLKVSPVVHTEDSNNCNIIKYCARLLVCLMSIPKRENLGQDLTRLKGSRTIEIGKPGSRTDIFRMLVPNSGSRDAEH
jgi:hypothetical protein